MLITKKGVGTLVKFKIHSTLLYQRRRRMRMYV